MLKKYVCWLILLSTFTVPVFALPQYELTEHTHYQLITQHGYFAGQATPIELTTKHSQAQTAIQNDIANIAEKLLLYTTAPTTTKGDNWLAFTLTNTASKQRTFYLAIDRSLNVEPPEIFTRTAKIAFRSITNQEVKVHAYLNELALLAGQSIDVFIHVQALGTHPLPISLHTSQHWNNELTEQYFGNGFAVGGLIALALVLMIAFVVKKEKSTLILATYISVKALMLSVLLGFNLSLLFSQDLQVKGLELPMLTALSGIFLLWFSVHLLQLKTLFPQWESKLKVLFGLLLLYIPLSTQLPLLANLVLVHFITITILLYLLMLGYRLNQINHKLGLVFVGVIGLQIFGFIIDLAVGSIGLNIFGDNGHITAIAYWFNALCMVYLLTCESNLQAEGQALAQKEALSSVLAARTAQAELLTQQEDNQELLEEKVQERTLELNIALQELEGANRELAEINTRDELTGLYNRRFYDQKILAEYRRSRRNLTPLSLLVVDIDFFKKVNDTYGHLAGDQCIVAVADAFKQCLRRSSDMACRYGGEEFCIILPETDTKGAITLAEELRTYIESRPIKYQDLSIDLTVSIGASTYLQQKKTGIDELFSAADRGLYLAKEQGRNQVQQHTINTSSAS